eukprot:5772399-Karenia_brevis.AAC.1
MFKINHNFYNYHQRKATPATQGFLNMLRTARFAPATNEQPGLTWIEILLISLAASTSPNATAMRRTATTAMTIGAQVAQFRKQALVLAKLVLHEADQQMFQVSKSPVNRLRGMGYANKLPQTKCQIELYEQEIAFVHLALLTIHSPLTKRQIKAFDNNSLQVQVHKFTYKGTAKWRPALLKLSHCYQHEHQQVASFATRQSDYLSTTTTTTQSDFNFECPQGHTREATQQVFCVVQPSRPVWCCFCKHSWGG